MPCRLSTCRRSALDRVVRSRWARGVLAAVLIPILVLGVFGGTTFLAHAHDGHGAHLHASHSIEQARFTAEQHRIAHALDTATCDDQRVALPSELIAVGDLSVPFEDPEGLVITIPDHEQIVPRGIDLSQTLQAAQAFYCVLAGVLTPPDVSQETGSPGGQRASGPLHLSTLTAGQRLVRTSGALLI